MTNTLDRINRRFDYNKKKKITAGGQREKGIEHKLPVAYQMVSYTCIGTQKKG